MLFSLGSKLSRKTNLGHLFTISAKKKQKNKVLFFACSMTIFGIVYLLLTLILCLLCTAVLIVFFFQYIHTNLFDKISSLLNEKCFPECNALDLTFHSRRDASIGSNISINS